MSLVASLEAKIAACENHIAIMREDLAANEKHLYNLHIQLQTASVPWHDDASSEDEGWRTAPAELPLSEIDYESEEEVRQDGPEAEHRDEMADLEEKHQEELQHMMLKEEQPKPVGTKIKWVLNEETYRVAVVTKKGVLQVKAVTDGGADCHEAGCKCNPCSEIALSGGAIPPWRRGRPLKKTFFASEADWHNSLPVTHYSCVYITEPAVSDKLLKKLSCDPLLSKTEPLQLKELEGRFPGGIFILSTNKGQFEVEYFYHTIFCRKEEVACATFNAYGGTHTTKPNLMVEWKGMYISLSHLF